VSRLGAALFGLLLVATVIVAGVVVHARTPKLELEVQHLTGKFSPNGHTTNRQTAKIEFFVRDSDPHATVQIVGPQRQRIRTLYRGPLVAGKDVTYHWNGRTNGGKLASFGERYRLRVVLPDQDRDMVYPQEIQLVGAGGQ
jgi:hypothetical protein